MAAIRHEEEEEEQNKTFSFGKYTTEEDFFLPAPSAREGLEYENTDESGRELFLRRR